MQKGYGISLIKLAENSVLAMTPPLLRSWLSRRAYGKLPCLGPGGTTGEWRG